MTTVANQLPPNQFGQTTNLDKVPHRDSVFKTRLAT